MVRDIRIKKDPVDYIISILTYNRNTNLVTIEAR